MALERTITHGYLSATVKDYAAKRARGDVKHEPTGLRDLARDMGQWGMRVVAGTSGDGPLGNGR